MFLKTTYQKIHKHRLYKDRQFHERLQNEKNIPIPFRLLALYLLFLRIGEAIFRFIIIILFDPGTSFDLIYKTRSIETLHISYTKFKTEHAKVRFFSRTTAVVIVIVSVTGGLFLNVITGVYKSAHAATYAWSQTEWNTLTSNNTGHPVPSNWTQYSATSTSISAGPTLQITITATSTTQSVPYFAN